MGESRGQYYSKWDAFAEEEAKRIEEEVEKEKEESSKRLGHDPAKPVCAKQAEEQAKREALRRAKEEWEKRKHEEFQAKLFITDEVDQRKTLTAEALEQRQVVHLRGCTGGEYTFPAGTTVTKIFIESCKGCTFFVNGRIITGHVEVWRSEGLVLDVGTIVGTIQADQCSGLHLRFPARILMGSVVFSGVTDLRAHFGDHDGGSEQDLRASLDAADAADDEAQFITRWVGGALLTEKIVRDAKEYPTTRRELEDEGRAHELQEEAVQKRADVKREEGNEAFKEGNWAQAAVFYTQAISIKPSATLHSNRSAAFLKLGEHEKALKDADDAVALEPGHQKGLFRRGLALHALGRYGEAAATLGKLADADPKNQQVKDAVRMAEYMARKQAAKGAAPASS